MNKSASADVDADMRYLIGGVSEEDEISRQQFRAFHRVARAELILRHPGQIEAVQSVGSCREPAAIESGLGRITTPQVRDTEKTPRCFHDLRPHIGSPESLSPGSGVLIGADDIERFDNSRLLERFRAAARCFAVRIVAETYLVQSVLGAEIGGINAPTPKVFSEVCGIFDPGEGPRLNGISHFDQCPLYRLGCGLGGLHHCPAAAAGKNEGNCAIYGNDEIPQPSGEYL